MAHRGRKRKVGLDRRPTGRPAAEQYRGVDRGTEELRAKRLLLMRSPADVSIDHPLDVLHARGLINLNQARAGWSLARLHWSLFTMPVARAGRYEEWIAGAGFRDDAAALELAAKRRRCELYRTALRAAGRRQERAVIHVAVDLRMPEAVLHRRPGPRARADIVACRLGLSALARRGRNYA